jgi:putative membrane protein insertion efficiency factor
MAGAAQRAVLAGIRAYQVLVSPWLGAHCRYAPSCSAYTAEAIRRYGLLRGTWYGCAAWVAVTRCAPADTTPFFSAHVAAANPWNAAPSSP